MAQTELTVDEVVDSLTGHDENAVHAVTSLDITELVKRPTLLMRAMAAIVLAREGTDPIQKTYPRAMEMTMHDVSEFFSEAEPESVPEDPQPPSGDGN